MNKSITQENQNDKQISLHMTSALKSTNVHQWKSVVAKIFQYLFAMIFANHSMYMSMITGKNTPSF
jgi:hypothetical protein